LELLNDFVVTPARMDFALDGYCRTRNSGEDPETALSIMRDYGQVLMEMKKLFREQYGDAAFAEISPSGLTLLPKWERKLDGFIKAWFEEQYQLRLLRETQEKLSRQMSQYKDKLSEFDARLLLLLKQAEKEEKTCPDNEEWHTASKKCDCKPGFTRNKENKCVDASELIEEISKEDEEDKEDASNGDDECSVSYIKQGMAELNRLTAEYKACYSRYLIYVNKFQKEVNNKATEICKNGMIAYCYTQAVNLAQTMDQLQQQIKTMTTDLIMYIGICPGLAVSLAAEGISIHSVVELISSATGADKVSQWLQTMQTRFNENGCDEDEIKQIALSINPENMDPDLIQDGGAMQEIPGDGVDNDADGQQDESWQTLDGYNIAIALYDSGSIKDDIFNLTVSGYGNLGTTPAGGLRTYGLNLPPGTYSATITAIYAPDNIGTFTITVTENGRPLASLSGSPAQGGSAVLTFTVSGQKD
jgi:hypothetical protein